MPQAFDLLRVHDKLKHVDLLVNHITNPEEPQMKPQQLKLCGTLTKPQNIENSCEIWKTHRPEEPMKPQLVWKPSQRVKTRPQQELIPIQCGLQVKN